jgi:predicted porin
MKKTLIAAGIAAVVAAPAFAEVSVSGQVKWTMTDGGTTGSETRYMTSDNALTFKASEDLGNGLTAFAQITLDTDAEAAPTATDHKNEKDAKLGFKGAFGTVVIGRMETLTEGVASAKMDDGRSGHAADTNLESSITVVGRERAVAYVSPTFNGFHFAAAGTSVKNTGDTSTFEDKEVLLAYDNGPLSLMFTHADLSATGGASAATEVQTITASYSMGDLKGTVQRVNSNPDSGAADSTDVMYRIDYKMGNNSILLGMKDAESNQDDVDVVKLTHNFSKQTGAYVGYRKTGDSAKANDIFVGAIHKF